MYGIFTYIWGIFGVNVGKFTIHRASGTRYREIFMGYLIGIPILTNKYKMNISDEVN